MMLGGMLTLFNSQGELCGLTRKEEKTSHCNSRFLGKALTENQLTLYMFDFTLISL